MEPSRGLRYVYRCVVGGRAFVVFFESATCGGLRRAGTVTWAGSASILLGGESARKGRSAALA
jgi:hypothetical protein